MARYAVTMLSGKNSIVPVFVPNYCPRGYTHASHTYTHVPDLASWGLAWTKCRADTIRTQVRQFRHSADDVQCGPVVTPSPGSPGIDTEKKGSPPFSLTHCRCRVGIRSHLSPSFHSISIPSIAMPGDRKREL